MFLFHYFVKYFYLFGKIEYMARTSLIILFFIFSISLFCQSPELKTQTITEYLKTRDFNKGKVKIFQDARLDSLMSKQKIAAQNNLEINGDVVYVSDRG